MDKTDTCICIDLGGTKLYSCLLGTNGVVIEEETVTNHGTSREDTLSLLFHAIDTLLLRASDKNITPRGIALGVPGITDPTSGTVLHAPSLLWNRFPLKDRLAEKYSLPIIIENDVNCAAMGLWASFCPDLHSLSFISIGTGIGCGTVYEGKLHRGFYFASGEIGCTLADVEDLHQSHPTFGSMESMASGTGMENQLRRHLAKPDAPAWNQGKTARDILKAYDNGDALAKEIVDNTRDYLAMSILSVATTLNPQVIFLGGGVFNSADFLVPQLSALVQSKLHFALDLRLCKDSRYRTVLGAMQLLNNEINY